MRTISNYFVCLNSYSTQSQLSSCGDHSFLIWQLMYMDAVSQAKTPNALRQTP